MMEFIVSLSGIVLTILISIVGYFLRQIHRTLQNLSIQVGTLTTDFAVSENSMKYLKRHCADRKEIQEKRFEKIETEITNLKQRK